MTRIFDSAGVQLRRWLALAVVAGAAMAFASSALAASVAVTDCTAVSAGYAVTTNGSGFAPGAVVNVYDNGVLRGTTIADSRGNVVDFAVLVFALPSALSFADTAGNEVTLTVTGCDEGGIEGAAPASTADCKDPAHSSLYRSHGACVSAVASKNK